MLLLVTAGGCAALTNNNDESIIRVQANSDSVKAQRLTLAGVSAMERGKLDYAFDKLMAAIEADPNYGPAHNNVGLLHYDEGNLYPAALAFERAMELMPENPTVYYNLGLTLEAAGKLYEALDLYWQATEINSTEPHYLGNLVRLRIRLGETSPDVVTQLQDLILIETRPDWKRWADRELALDLNMALDRGPETPDFNAASAKGDNDGPNQKRTQNRVIQLTPEDQSAGDEDERNQDSEIRPRPSSRLPKPRPARPAFIEPPSPEPSQRPASNARESRSATLNPAETSSTQIPIQSGDSFESLPPSIEMTPEPELSDLLREER